jgi:hypothetical protein
MASATERSLIVRPDICNRRGDLSGFELLRCRRGIGARFISPDADAERFRFANNSGVNIPRLQSFHERVGIGAFRKRRDL